MERKVITTPERVVYTLSVEEFKEKLGITDSQGVLTVSIGFRGKVEILMSWTELG